MCHIIYLSLSLVNSKDKIIYSNYQLPFQHWQFLHQVQRYSNPAQWFTHPLGVNHTKLSNMLTTSIAKTVFACNIWKYIPHSWYRQVSNIRPHLSRQLNCWSLRCSWSIACRRCSNYIFILDLTPDFKGLAKDDFKTRWESFKFWDLVLLILEILG